MRRAYLASGTFEDIRHAADLIMERTGHPPLSCRAHPKTTEILLRSLPRPNYGGMHVLKVFGIDVRHDETMPEGVVEMTPDERP